jgi:hypothetical protein
VNATGKEECRTGSPATPLLMEKLKYRCTLTLAQHMQLNLDETGRHLMRLTRVRLRKEFEYFR